MKNKKTYLKKHSQADGKMAFTLLRLLLGGVFLYAAYGKILHPAAFAEAVYNYQLLPDATINLAALTLPWLELLVGICLITGVWLPGATLMSTGLLTVFVAILVVSRIRGLDIRCGCFSTGSTEDPINLWTVIRDICFLAISGYLVLTVFCPAEGFSNSRSVPMHK